MGDGERMKEGDEGDEGDDDERLKQLAEKKLNFELNAHVTSRALHLREFCSATPHFFLPPS